MWGMKSLVSSAGEGDLAHVFWDWGRGGGEKEGVGGEGVREGGGVSRKGRGVMERTVRERMRWERRGRKGRDKDKERSRRRGSEEEEETKKRTKQGKDEDGKKRKATMC